MACLRPHSQDRVELGFEPRPSDKERAFASCLGVCVATHSGSGSSPRNPPRPGEGAPSQGQPHPVTVALGTASILSTPGTGERNAGPAQPCSALQGRTHSPASSATPALGSIRGHLTPAFTPRQSWVSATAAGRRSQHLSRWRVPQPPPYAPALSPTPLSAWDQFLCQAQAGPHWVQGPSTTTPGGGVAARLTGHRHLSWRPPPPGGQALHILVPAFFTPPGHSRFSSLLQ